jgi:argininosuccinate lyase
MPKKPSSKKFKAWKGRFAGETSPLMQKFNASLSFDQRLYAIDIRGSIAYARALQKAKILKIAECRSIVKGLRDIEKEIAAGTFPFSEHDEDIHMAIERRLIESIGPAGAKLHTGRSRNDQVITDVRIFIREAIALVVDDVRNLQRTLVDFAEAHPDIIIAGYTHLQQAQPVLLSHYVLSLAWALDRDAGRLQDCAKRIDALPLGSGALAGNPLGIDQKALADELGFGALAPNSLDAVADRDGILEFLFAATTILLHLSRYAEDLSIWCSQEYGYIELSDSVSTGSSLMPQKKNPDSLELIRGKSGRVLGNAMTLATVMKGLPMAYGKDLQEDKEPLFDTVDTVSICLQIFQEVIEGMAVRTDRVSAGLDQNMLATDLADYLVHKGVPFRDSHAIIGKVVRQTLQDGLPLNELPLETYQSIDTRFAKDVFTWLDMKTSVARRTSKGGTAPKSVKAQIRALRRKTSNRKD